jgi:hypothetical protein
MRSSRSPPACARPTTCPTAAIILLIQQLATGPIPDVIQILNNVARKDPDDRVRRLALNAISEMAAREMTAMTRAVERRETEVAATSRASEPPPDRHTPSAAPPDRAGR